MQTDKTFRVRTLQVVKGVQGIILDRVVDEVIWGSVSS
jgi:hypothetical protein